MRHNSVKEIKAMRRHFPLYNVSIGVQQFSKVENIIAYNLYKQLLNRTLIRQPYCATQV